MQFSGRFIIFLLLLLFSLLSLSFYVLRSHSNSSSSSSHDYLHTQESQICMLKPMANPMLEDFSWFSSTPMRFDPSIPRRNPRCCRQSLCGDLLKPPAARERLSLSKFHWWYLYVFATRPLKHDILRSLGLRLGMSWHVCLLQKNPTQSVGAQEIAWIFVYYFCDSPLPALRDSGHWSGQSRDGQRMSWKAMGFERPIKRQQFLAVPGGRPGISLFWRFNITS